MPKRQYKERRIYFAGECTGCGNSFQSFKRSRIKTGLCRACRKSAVPKGQDSLFGVPIDESDIMHEAGLNFSVGKINPQVIIAHSNPKGDNYFHKLFKSMKAK